jgi:hypothetical protein
MAQTWARKKNPKHEVRNSKQIQNSKAQNSKQKQPRTNTDNHGQKKEGEMTLLDQSEFDLNQ